VVVTLVAKTLMGAQFAPFVREIIESMGLDRMQIVPPADGAAAAAPVALGDWIETLVRQAAEIDLSALGWVGVAVTVTSAIWLMTSIELSFNRVCHARAGRAWLRRLVLYWFVLTATPLLLAAIPLLSSILSSFRDTPGVGWIAHAAGTVWGVVVLWGLLTLVYLVVPAGRVRVQYAAIGALAAATVIIALKSLLAAYFERIAAGLASKNGT
jgi:membrane protein